MLLVESFRWGSASKGGLTASSLHKQTKHVLPLKDYERRLYGISCISINLTEKLTYWVGFFIQLFCFLNH